MKWDLKYMDTAEAAALKVLGDGAEISDKYPDIGKLIDEAEKASDAANKTREQLLKDIEDSQDALSKIINAVKLTENKMAKDDFGLDEKSAEDKKKILQARKLLLTSVQRLEKEAADRVKLLDQAEKANAGQLP